MSKSLRFLGLDAAIPYLIESPLAGGYRRPPVLKLGGLCLGAVLAMADVAKRGQEASTGPNVAKRGQEASTGPKMTPR